MVKTMNIHAKEGDKVVFAYPNNGLNSDKEKAAKYLQLYKEYTVDSTVVRSSSTDVYLKEIPDVHFNSVHFIDKF
ncbi:hypothetical protein H1Z61_12020 [Bacillus aquiflavi]|uniref:Uncharacterized protein n=1 Tax=Bacillus aquiflavi TaxID=2672567 RepID=A0A6B3W3M5_9BACI|nr:hypothetical protein [Bacillus aquiflavi]MBA4537838.1 hypothetical protein [Bacillus aquiflavi]NEY82094.1 hypothetical protein [Bacillus aquiflavi]UAC48344.1 hypothetical protein K6959_17845 [Bacillus aquiflavi]